MFFKFGRMARFAFGVALLVGAAISTHAVPEKVAGDAHRFSTLFTAQSVRDDLATRDGITSAIEWCRRYSIYKIYLETFRHGYQAERAVLENACDRFREAGFAVGGCVTTTQVGKRSTGKKIWLACYTDPATQQQLQEIFEFTAEIFDVVMIDDFFSTDCECEECNAARLAKMVTVGERRIRVAADTWSAYRMQLMLEVSRDRVMAASKRRNPRVHMILKYPNWYEEFHERGYDVIRQTELFDQVWVGTETRDFNAPKWGGLVQYGGYFIMRWMEGIAGEKCGGAWNDTFQTSTPNYIEQQRQAILGGAKETFLFSFPQLQRETGPANLEAWRKELPEMMEVAREVAGRVPHGIAAYKPPHSSPGGEPRIYDMVGMLGLPLVPCHQFPTTAPVAFFPAQAASDPEFVSKLEGFVKRGQTAIITSGLAARLETSTSVEAKNIVVFPVRGRPRTLLQMDEQEVAQVRADALRPLGITFDAPTSVSLYLFTDGSSVVENFRDTAAQVRLNGKQITVPPREWVCDWRQRKAGREKR